MRLFLLRSTLPIYLLFAAVYSCGQNGPTPPSVNLNWAQSSSAGVTGNCVYRGSVAGTYALPALFCSTAPITSYTDLTVSRGTTYHYAVTAQVGKTEGGYSNDATAPVPLAPAAPSLNPPLETKLSPPVDGRPGELVARIEWQRREDRR